jgi:predicted NAD-dependent protein-ADP-ribosyltransferase YbiA (DUF1768 family)
MKDIIFSKFSNNLDLQNLLLKIKDFIIIEGNNWNDDIWGACWTSKKIGNNNLGIILMQVRNKILNNKKA